MPNNSILRLGYSVPYLYNGFYYNYVGNYNIAMKLGRNIQFDELKKIGSDPFEKMPPNSIFRLGYSVP